MHPTMEGKISWLKMSVLEREAGLDSRWRQQNGLYTLALASENGFLSSELKNKHIAALRADKISAEELAQ